MSIFSPAVRRHVEANAPALLSGAGSTIRPCSDGVFRKSTSTTAVGTSARCRALLWPQTWPAGRVHLPPAGWSMATGSCWWPATPRTTSQRCWRHWLSALSRAKRSAADTVSRGIGGCATSSGSDPCHRTEDGARPARARCRTVPWCATRNSKTRRSFDSARASPEAGGGPPYSTHLGFDVRTQGGPPFPSATWRTTLLRSVTGWRRLAVATDCSAGCRCTTTWASSSTWRADLRRSHRTDDPVGLSARSALVVRNMTHHRSSVTAGPTFAYRATADSWSGRVALAVRSSFPICDVPTSERSRSHIQRFAVSPTALHRGASFRCAGSSYGMAESVLLATTVAIRAAPEGRETSAA